MSEKMKKDNEILEKYFEEARNSQQLFPMEQARSILEDHIAGKLLHLKVFGRN
jgi:hypothetical protein